MMGPYMWQWMQGQGVAPFSGWMWAGFWFWGIAGLVITVEVIVLLWLWIKKLLKELK